MLLKVLSEPMIHCNVFLKPIFTDAMMTTSAVTGFNDRGEHLDFKFKTDVSIHTWVVSLRFLRSVGTIAQ